MRALPVTMLLCLLPAASRGRQASEARQAPNIDNSVDESAQPLISRRKEITLSTLSMPGTSTCCGLNNPSLRIVGGTEARPHEFPWAVGLAERDAPRTFCGGSIINDRYILTAAHCLRRKAEELEVLVGEHDLTVDSDVDERREVDALTLHPLYSAATHVFDFGLVRLKEVLVFDDSNLIAPVCMPFPGTYASSPVQAVGWGRLGAGKTQPDKLQKVMLKTMFNIICNLMYPLKIKPCMMCARGSFLGGKDTCQGDSGGPLTASRGGRQMLVGVTSWGEGCAGALKPGVYGRVTSALDWIQENTKDATYC